MTASLIVALALGQPPTITAAAGTGERGYTPAGVATQVKLDQPFDVAFDRAGDLYFSDTFNHRVCKVVLKTGQLTTVAGSGKKGYTGDGGPAIAAMLNEPYGVELDADGNLFIVDRLNFVIRRVEGKTGVITTVAGNGKPAYGGDGGPATQAGLKEPNGICLDGKGKLYIADVADHRVRVVDLKTGIITTLCGTGKGARVGDGGPFKDAALLGPRAVAVGPDGKLYVVERNGNCVRRIDFATGLIERFAGTGVRGYAGDGGAALDATFDGPKEIDIDKDGNVYVVDTENEAVRRIDARSRMVTTVAGRGRTKTPGQGDGGPATAATLGRPHGVAVGPDGGIYIGDTNAHRIRVVR
ncbi:MAG: hypothetical protein U0804_08380 [Gemmataceae bacterium]